MDKPSKIVIGNREIKVDRETRFISVTDLGNAAGTNGGTDFVNDWLRTPNTLAFIREWENASNPNFDCRQLDTLVNLAGPNAFRTSADELIEAGATGILTKTGRNVGTYCSVDWAVHFASWLSPRFFVWYIQAHCRLTSQLYGPDVLDRPFRWELVTET